MLSTRPGLLWPVILLQEARAILTCTRKAGNSSSTTEIIVVSSYGRRHCTLKSGQRFEATLMLQVCASFAHQEGTLWLAKLVTSAYEATADDYLETRTAHRSYSLGYGFEHNTG